MSPVTTAFLSYVNRSTSDRSPSRAVSNVMSAFGYTALVSNQNELILPVIPKLLPLLDSNVIFPPNPSSVFSVDILEILVSIVLSSTSV